MTLHDVGWCLVGFGLGLWTPLAINFIASWRAKRKA